MHENIPFLSIVTHATTVTSSRNTSIDLDFENEALVQQVEHISIHFTNYKASFVTIERLAEECFLKKELWKIKSGMQLYLHTCLSKIVCLNLLQDQNT